jgi:Type III secretion protein (HpaP)
MSKSAIAPAVQAAPALAALPTRVRAPAEARVSAATRAPTPREAGSQFAALLDAATAPTNSNPAVRAEGSKPHAGPSLPQGESIAVHTGPMHAHTAVQESTRLPTQPPHPAAPQRDWPSDRSDAAQRAAEPAAAGKATTTNPLLQQHEGPRTPPRQAHATSAADDIERLIDELAEFVLRQPGARAQRWSVTLWLRASVLRDTRLAMSGEPGRIAISFASDNAASLRRLHAGHEALQARLRERIAVPTLDLTIDAIRPEERLA